MPNFLEQMKNLVMKPPYSDDDYDDEYMDDEYYDEPAPQPMPRNVTPIRPSRVSSSRDKVVNINTSVSMQVVISYPESLEEAGEVCKRLKDRMTVVINLEKTEPNVAQRISDFLCGAGFALDCSIQSISDVIFIVCPNNVAITSKFQKDLAANGIKIPNTAMWGN